MYSVTKHLRFGELWDAKASAYNALTEVLVNNGLEEEISKVIALQHAQKELCGIYEEVAFDNGVLDTINHIKGILRENKMSRMEEAK
ncbi:hypothetical protein [Lysinibacillus sphaericus]|uniref:Uncharacterized protein n=1 Tax=Lysinibacillus sphaericus OT4b.31 TaxID=1285586 RepID=R7ZIG7_LYSSH|nr:hypothetical protein [Lysinibacillus sphaericus]EON73851.1 hypothetical protein H131_04279 [Lysinibacillus sphaericus OT4b.31]